MDDDVRSGLGEFLAHARDRDLEGVRRHLLAEAVYALLDVLAGDDAARTAQQHFEDVGFALAELDVEPVNLDLARGRIERNAAGAEHRRQRARGPAHEGAAAGE